VKRILITLLLLAVSAPGATGARAGAPAIDPSLVRAYAAEAAALARRDNGALWGRSLEGPVLFVDPATRRAVSSEPDRERKLAPEGGVFVGLLPAHIPAANTAVDWAGVRWSVVRWPLPEDAGARARLLAHELFHRMQGELGLPATDLPNPHLDTLEGRYWLRLEWRALRAALASDGPARARAVADALAFRARRRAIFSAADAAERALELNEGLAEYTGCALAHSTVAERTAAALGLLDGAAERPTFVRSFAYVSGPAYGLLLDERGADWRRALTPSSDLGALLGAAYDARPDASARAAARRAATYGGPALLTAERDRDRRQREVVAAYRAGLVEGPVLRLPLRKMQVSFDPNALVSLGDDGTVYPELRLTDEWGTLTVTGGALVAADWSSVVVSAPREPAAGSLGGDGWSLDLAPGWRAAPNGSAGSYTLVSDRPPR
jgi:hypothetical protein